MFLRRGQLAFQPGVELGGGVEGAGEGFEDGFDFVVGILTVERHDVDIDPGFTRQGVEEVAHEVGFKGTDGRSRELTILDIKRTAATIDRNVRQCLVHRDGDGGGAQDAAMVAEGFPDGLSEADTDILDGVVAVNAEVTVNTDFKVELAVAGKKGQKVVKRTNSRFD